MKTPPKMEISDDLEEQIKESIRISELCETDVVRQALSIGRPQLPGFPVFAVFYRWDGQTLTVINVAHTVPDLPARLAGLFSAL